MIGYGEAVIFFGSEEIPIWQVPNSPCSIGFVVEPAPHVLLVNWENHVHFWSESFRKERKTFQHHLPRYPNGALQNPDMIHPYIFPMKSQQKTPQFPTQEKHVVYSIDGNAIFLPFNMKYIIWSTHRTQHGLSIELLQAMQALRSCVPAPCFCELTV